MEISYLFKTEYFLDYYIFTIYWRGIFITKNMQTIKAFHWVANKLHNYNFSSPQKVSWKRKLFSVVISNTSKPLTNACCSQRLWKALWVLFSHYTWVDLESRLWKYIHYTECAAKVCICFTRHDYRHIYIPQELYHTNHNPLLIHRLFEKVFV